MSSPALIEQLDCAVDVLLSDPDAAISNVDSSVAELLSVAAELRTLPRPEFRDRLRDELTRGVPVRLGADRAPTSANNSQIGSEQPSRAEILPTFLGVGYGTYAVRRSNFALSLAAHAIALVLILTSGLWLSGKQARQELRTIALSVDEYMPITPDVDQARHGGGGGGDHDKITASEGHLPKLAKQQITPPELVVRKEHPKMTAEPTIVMPPRLNLADNHLPSLGNPVSSVIGPPSNGIGYGSGIGSGSGGGIGSGSGIGVGPGFGAGIGGGVFSVGGGVSEPRVLYKPEPEYSPEARQAKLQGTVILSIVVGSDGRAHDLKVDRSLGMGLDERAIEAVRQWRFDPAKKDGKPVSVAVEVEVSFRLF